jgi:hypothetical protein
MATTATIATVARRRRGFPFSAVGSSSRNSSRRGLRLAALSSSDPNRRDARAVLSLGADLAPAAVVAASSARDALALRDASALSGVSEKTGGH